ncbi:MAG: DUF1883 domain-containing protein [Planctomycetota bacterium]
MDYLHYELETGSNDTIEVTLDHAANVLLLDRANYDLYRQGRDYRYRGGYVKSSPYSISPPHAGRWHLVVNLGGYAGTVRASARVIRRQGVSA